MTLLTSSHQVGSSLTNSRHQRGGQDDATKDDKSGVKHRDKPKNVLSLGRESKETRKKDNADLGQYALPWDERSTFPAKTFLTTMFSCFLSSKFWRRIDWTFRAGILSTLPAMILSYAPATESFFMIQGTVVTMAFWVSCPTLGAGLCETFNCLKGFAIGCVAHIIIYAACQNVKPTPMWLKMVLFAIFLLAICIGMDSVMKHSTYALATLMISYIAGTNAHYGYAAMFYLDTVIGVSMALPSFFIPWPSLTVNAAKNGCYILGNTTSVNIQGICASFWASPQERELNLVKIRLLRHTLIKALRITDDQLDLSKFEPHDGLTLAAVSARRQMLKELTYITRCSSVVIEVLAQEPDVAENPTSTIIGARLQEPLAYLASSIDTFILKIVDFSRVTNEREKAQFADSVRVFEEEVSQVRQEVTLNNENYEPDRSDILMGFFLFNLMNFCELLMKFEEPTSTPPTWKEWVFAPYTWLKNTWFGLVYIVRGWMSGHLTRRVKEAVKLSGSIVVATVVQFYSHGSLDPVAGATVISWLYMPTGSQSFKYAFQRTLGTTIGSVLGFIGAEIAGNRIAWNITIQAVLCTASCFVQTSREWNFMGNAMVYSVFAIGLVGSAEQATASIRIQSNVFAATVYFVITSVLWPSRATSRIRLELDSSIRCLREAANELLHGIKSDDAETIISAAEDHIKDLGRHIKDQDSLLESALTEPTMVGAPFPKEQWMQMIDSLRNMLAVLRMMKEAYRAFTFSKQSNSVHWSLLEAIRADAAEFGDYLYATIDLYLLLLSEVTVVPTSHLVRLRVCLMGAQSAVESAYLDTLTEQLLEDHESPFQQSFDSSRVTTTPTSKFQTEKVSTADELDSNRESRKDASIFVPSESSNSTVRILENNDNNSVSAFVFGIRALVSDVGNLEKALVEMGYVEEMHARL